MIDLEKLAEARKAIEEMREEIGGLICDLELRAEELSRQCGNLALFDRELSREEFSKFLEIGFTLGAEIEAEGMSAARPVIVTGITCEGFVVTDANNKEYQITRRYLKHLDKIKVVGNIHETEVKK